MCLANSVLALFKKSQIRTRRRLLGWKHFAIFFDFAERERVKSTRTIFTLLVYVRKFQLSKFSNNSSLRTSQRTPQRIALNKKISERLNVVNKNFLLRTSY